jgi:hypothetical protein
MRTYRSLELRLWHTRWRHEGEESSQEDAILDEMEHVWLTLNDQERELLREEEPRCWPMDPCSWPPEPLPSSTPAPDPWRYEGFRSPADAILDADAA